jgi:aminoglycoside phosphotransferase (APT) family kinase protein
LAESPATLAALGRPVARGWTAELYAYGPGRVLKLLHTGRPRAMAEREASIGAIAHRAGIPAPAIDGVVEIEGRFGTVFERIDGPSMLEAINARPWLTPGFAAQLGELHARIHQAPVAPDAALRKLADELRRKIGRVTSLPDAVRAGALAQLSHLEQRPSELRLCHGDFHPGNIILSPRGPMIVDWNDATLGAPAADVARTRMLILYAGGPPLARGIRQKVALSLRRALFALPLHRYHAGTGIDEREVAEWRLPVMAARMLEVASHRQQS